MLLVAPAATAPVEKAFAEDRASGPWVLCAGLPLTGGNSGFFENPAHLPALKLGHNTKVVAWQLQSESHINVKTPEQEAVLRSIRKLVDFWRISPEELEFDASGIPSELPEIPVPSPKYRHPISGDTWDGQGSQPQWLRDALTRGGYTVDELRCTSPESIGLGH